MEGVVALSNAAAGPCLEALVEMLVARHRDRAVRLACCLVGGDLSNTTIEEDESGVLLPPEYAGIESILSDG